VSKNAKHWYWEMGETDETAPQPRTAVLEEPSSRTFPETPCPASADWFEVENKTAMPQKLSRTHAKLQLVVWGPEHAFVVEIAHRPASPQSITTKEA